jgi:hypothetical protein
MKILSIEINAQIQIPDEWELVEHPSGVQALKIGDKFVEFDLTPLSTTSNDPEATWSDEDSELTNQLLDAITEWDAELTIEQTH